MTDDKQLRMEVYREGQRAHHSGVPCHYVGWKAGTWEKGRAAAKAFYELQDTTLEERSFDDSENGGNYYNDCHHCGRVFIGYKRRGECKVCAAAQDQKT